jgi:hypothetical protein
VAGDYVRDEYILRCIQTSQSKRFIELSPARACEWHPCLVFIGPRRITHNEELGIWRAAPMHQFVSALVQGAELAPFPLLLQRLQS